jgi:hypothetical protein
MNTIESKGPKLYEVKVDSVLLSIPLDRCEILDQNLIDIITTYKVNVSSGEVISETKKLGEPFTKRFNGISFKVWTNYQLYYYADGRRVNKLYISFLANSKQLEGSYFGGITKDTLYDYYNKIMDLSVFKCSYTDLKAARYSDTDICFDFKATEIEFDVLKTNLKNSVLDNRFIHTTNSQTNSGIWTPTRKDPRDQATPSKPYVKLYSKEKDFTYNSTEFADAYFKPETYKDLIRFEAGVINAKHKDRLGIPKGCTFFEFLNLDLQLICKQLINEYLIKPKMIKAKGLTPTEVNLLNAINKITDLGGTKNDVYEIFDLSGQFTDRSTIARSIQRYNKIINNEQINREKLEANSITENVFEFLGIKI